MDHDLTPAELRAINDLRTAARKLAGAFERNADKHPAAASVADDLLLAVDEAAVVFDSLTGQSHKPLVS